MIRFNHIATKRNPKCRFQIYYNREHLLFRVASSGNGTNESTDGYVIHRRLGSTTRLSSTRRTGRRQRRKKSFPWCTTRPFWGTATGGCSWGTPTGYYIVLFADYLARKKLIDRSRGSVRFQPVEFYRRRKAPRRRLCVRRRRSRRGRRRRRVSAQVCVMNGQVHDEEGFGQRGQRFVLRTRTKTNPMSMAVVSFRGRRRHRRN